MTAGRAAGGERMPIFQNRDLGGPPLPFAADGALFQSALEAQRLRLAWLFDPYLAVTTSAVEPLLHQITAVYGELLRRQPLRFLLADDPGAGKTIMAGLKELIARGDLRRCLIVAPGSLVEPWQDELAEKFGLETHVLARERADGTAGGNPFLAADRWIVRLDQLSRSEGPWCTDQRDGRIDPSSRLFHAMRTNSGRPSSSMRFRARTAMATSVA
jgi:SNF2 family DNA or RNA helicase